MNITKKVRNNKEYFYLKHSQRIDRKIITKEKYLGTEIPKDIDKIKENFYREINKDLFNKLDKIKDKFQENWNKIPESVKEQELRELSIAFTYNTNAIEGSTITLPETRNIIEYKQASNKLLYEVEETKRHSKVFLNVLKKKEEITNELILKWHKEMFKETKEDMAGIFREYQVKVGNYLAPEYKEVIPLMNDLIRFINNSKLHTIELAARSHYIFEMIHPFGDGNGRVGRLLMNYILWHNNYPMIIIEFKKRDSYYKVLEKEEQDFLNYFIKLYLKVHGK